MDSPVRSDPSYRFGLFEVFPETGRLFRQGQRVKLQEQPFKLLLLLVEKPGEIVPRFTPENREANQAFVDLVGKFAQQKKATPAQIALAWVLAQKPWLVKRWRREFRFNPLRRGARHPFLSGWELVNRR